MVLLIYQIVVFLLIRTLNCSCGPGQKLSPCRDSKSKFHFHLKCVAGPTHCGKKVQPTYNTWFENGHATIHQASSLYMLPRYLTDFGSICRA